jgi:hypothetical protein
MFEFLQWLGRAKVLGMNRRNAGYILPWNARSLYPLVDNKVFTKKLAAQFGIPAPALYAVIKDHGDVQNIDGILAGREEFVVKPARGSGGSGILLITGQGEKGLTTKSGEEISKDEFKYSIADILSGIYSLGGLEVGYRGGPHSP